MTIKKIKRLIKKNWLLIVIFLAATILRTWDIPNRIIFFDDAAYDIRSAQHALKEGEIPLLGIPSSVPRFKQGPLTVWIHMLTISLFGSNLLALSAVFIVFSLMSLVLVYEFCDRYLNKKVSLVATTLIAFSPLAIAQARMPYHTNPIPLATILYLFALVRLYEKKRYSIFWAILSWAILFQFELAVFPLILVVPYILYRTNRLKVAVVKDHWKEMSVAFVLGLLPQIIYDVQHTFSQLGLFFVWIGYRIVSLFGGEHSFGGNKIESFSHAFWQYGGRIFSTDNWLVSSVIVFIFLYGGVMLIKQFKKKNNIIPKGIEIVVVVTALLMGSYLVHGSPSEAYFPPFIVLLPIFVAYVLVSLFKHAYQPLFFFMIAYAGMNTYAIFQHNFFVSNTQKFSYGYSVKEQKAVVDFITTHSEGDYQLDTTREMRKFKSVFDNLRFLSEQKGFVENKKAKKYYYIEDKNSILREMPLIKVEHFPSVDVYYYEQ